MAIDLSQPSSIEYFGREKINCRTRFVRCEVTYRNYIVVVRKSKMSGNVFPVNSWKYWYITTPGNY